MTAAIAILALILLLTLWIAARAMFAVCQVRKFLLDNSLAYESGGSFEFGQKPWNLRPSHLLKESLKAPIEIECMQKDSAWRKSARAVRLDEIEQQVLRWKPLSTRLNALVNHFGLEEKVVDATPERIEFVKKPKVTK